MHGQTMANIDDTDNMKSQLNQKKKKKIVLKVALQGDEDPLRVKVKTTTAWNKIFKSFSDYKGRDVKLLRFLHDGEKINPNQTVGEVLDDLEDDDEEVQIDVMFEQQGGNEFNADNADQ